MIKVVFSAKNLFDLKTQLQEFLEVEIHEHEEEQDHEEKEEHKEKGKRGRKPKVEKEAHQEEVPQEKHEKAQEKVIPPEKREVVTKTAQSHSGQSTKDSQESYDQMVTALGQLNEKRGFAVCKELLLKFGASRVSEVKEEDRPKVIEACNKAKAEV